MSNKSSTEVQESGKSLPVSWDTNMPLRSYELSLLLHRTWLQGLFDETHVVPRGWHLFVKFDQIQTLNNL